MQLRGNCSELIKEEVFEEVYKQVLKGENKNSKLVDLIFKYFYGNPQLFKLHHQPLEEKPTINYHQNKKCYSCGIKGHIKRNCKVQGLTEEEIEWVFSKPTVQQEEVTKKEEYFYGEVLYEDIPSTPPYDCDPYED